MRTGLACWLAMASLDGAALAHAQDRFDVPASCGTARELDQEWSKLVGGRASSSARPRVELTPVDDVFRLQVQAASGPRVLTDRDCRVLFRTAVLLVALAMAEPGELSPEQRAVLQPVAVDPPPSALPPGPPPDAQRSHAEPTTAPPTAAETASPSAPAVRRPRQPPAPWSGSASLRAGIALGLVPGVTAALAVDGTLRKGRWGLVLGARYLTPREHISHSELGVKVDSFAALAGIVCDLVPALGLGLALQGLGMRGRGSANLTSKNTDFVWLWGPRADLLWRPWRGEHLDLELAVGGLYLPDNARFQLNDERIVYRTSHLSLETALGLRWRFP